MLDFGHIFAQSSIIRSCILVFIHTRRIVNTILSRTAFDNFFSVEYSYKCIVGCCSYIRHHISSSSAMQFAICSKSYSRSSDRSSA